MDEEEAVEANTDGPNIWEEMESAFPKAPRWGSDEPIRAQQPGQEIDARPDPAGVHISDETQLLKRPEPVAATLWPDGNTTGAFISRAASIRHEVKPYRWWDRISPAMLVIWVGFVGVPAGAGAWAAYEVWRRVHGS